MPWGVAAGVVGSVAGSAISSAMNGSSGGSSSPYIGAYQGAMDTDFYNNYNSYANALNGYYGTTSADALATYQNSYNNPYASNYLTGAGQAQSAYYGAGSNTTALANQLAQSAQSWGSNGQVQQNMEQTASDTANAQSYLRGTQNSPYGATTATNAVSQADLSYQQTAANEQSSLAQAASSLYGQGAGYTNTASGLTYNAQNAINSNQNSAISNYYNSVSPYLQGLNQLDSNALTYLGYGTTSQNTAAGQLANSASAYSNLGYQAGTGLYNAYNSGSSGYDFSTGSSVLSSPSTYDYYGSGLY